MVLDILYSSIGKRDLGLKGLEPDKINLSGLKLFRQNIAIHSGINKENGKLINKIIKDSGLKVSSQYLNEKIRVTGKKIDDLQKTFKLLREHKDVIIELAMENMK